jgi:hypothetical protein
VITDIKTDPFIFKWSVDVAGHEWKRGTDSELRLFERGGFERKIRVYHPLRKSGLFIEFAALEPSRYAILQFANRSRASTKRSWAVSSTGLMAQSVIGSRNHIALPEWYSPTPTLMKIFSSVSGQEIYFHPRDTLFKRK